MMLVVSSMMFVVANRLEPWETHEVDAALPIYYPADLPLQLEDIIPNAHTLDLRRKGGGIVAREQLTLDGKPVAYGEKTDRTLDALASILYAAAEEHAGAHHRGNGKYIVRATYAKPRTGPNPKPRDFDFQVGDSEETTDAAHRSDLLAEMRADRRVLTGEISNLLDKTIRMAGVVATTVEGLANAFANITERERTHAREGLEQQMMREESDRSARRERMAFQLFGPMLKQLMAGKAAMGLPPATDTSTPLATKARAFASSLSPQQLDDAARHLGEGARERFGELLEATDDATVLAFGAWLFAKDTEAIMQASAGFEQRQSDLAETLYADIIAAAQRKDESPGAELLG